MSWKQKVKWGIVSLVRQQGSFWVWGVWSWDMSWEKHKRHIFQDWAGHRFDQDVFLDYAPLARRQHGTEHSKKIYIYMGWKMSRRINKIKLSSWLYSGRKGSGSGAGKEMRQRWRVLEWKQRKSTGREKYRQERGIMRDLYMLLAHHLSLCIMKKTHTKAKELTRLVCKHNDLRERERERGNHEVGLRAWLWLSQCRGYLELKHSICTIWAFMIAKT